MRFSGLDHISAAFNAGTWIVVTAFVAFALPRAFLVPVLAAGALVAALAAGARYRLRISPEGVELTLLAAWVVPSKPLRYLLDARIDFYESWEAERPEGVYVEAVHWGEPDSPCFGPSFSQRALAELRAAANEAIHRARAALPPTPPELRNDLLAPHLGALDLAGAKRDQQGRLEQITLLQPIRLGELTLPAGSILELNRPLFERDPYLDPRRADRLSGVTAQSRFPLPAGLEVQPGSWIPFSQAGRPTAVNGKLGELQRDGFWIDGDQVVDWDEEGRLTGFTLSRETEFGGWRLPAGSRLSRWGFGPLKDQGYYCTLSGPLRLPELELSAGDRVIFDKATRRLVEIYPRAGRLLDGERMTGGPLHVRPDGKIDRRRARRDFHLVRERSPSPPAPSSPRDRGERGRHQM